MTREEKIGQMLQVAVHADYESYTNPEYMGEKARTEKYQVGSVDVRIHRVGENLVRPKPITVSQVLNRLQDHQRLPLLVGADLERGVIARVADSQDGPLLMAYGSGGDAAAARKLGEITARQSRAVGIHWAFAPVADLNSNPDNPVIGDRSFGEDPNLVSQMVSAYVEGAHSGGMLVTAKHFPGQGDTSMDSHVGIVTLNQSLEHLRKVEFAPFRAAIAAGVDAVMLAHARVPSLDPDPLKVATTSSTIIQTFLRGELKFKGVVITDALEMKGLTDLYNNDPQPTARAAVDAIKAGVDVVMLPDHVDEVFNAILAAVNSGEIPESRIDESVRRILALKARARLFSNRFVDQPKMPVPFSGKDDFSFAQDVADKGVVLVRNTGFVLPMNSGKTERVTVGSELRPARLVVVLFNDSEHSPLGRVFEEELRGRKPDAFVYWVHYDNRAEPSWDEIAEATRSADQVIVGAFITNLPSRKFVTNGRIVSVFGMNGTSARLFSQIVDIGGKKVMVVALGSPYLILKYPTIRNYACTFSVSSTSERAIVKALFGEIHNHAKLPITLPGVANRGSAVPWPQRASDVEPYEKILP